MDEKTTALRDLFLEVADAETITERQQESHGSLGSDDDTDERLRQIVRRMRERFEFRTSLSDEALVTVITRFYAGDTDTAIGRTLDTSPKTIARARTCLHLLREDDFDAPFDVAAFAEAVGDDRTVADLATAFDVSESTARWYRRVVLARDEQRRVADQYRDEFENVLQDRELSERLTESTRRTGLEDATEGGEMDVSF